MKNRSAWMSSLTWKTVAAAGVLALAALPGCAEDGRRLTVSDSVEGRMYHARASSSFAVAVTAEGRRDQEAHLIRLIEARLPPEQRQTQVALLRSTSPMATSDELALRPKGMENIVGIRWVGSTDPVMADLLGELHQVREEMMREAHGDRVSAARPKVDVVVTIRLAVVPERRLSGNQALVIRQPGDGGVPLVVVSAAGLAASHLERALRLALASHDHMPQSAARANTARVSPDSALDGQSDSAEDSPRWGPLIAELKRSPPAPVGDVRDVRSIEVRLTRDLVIVP